MEALLDVHKVCWCGEKLDPHLAEIKEKYPNDIPEDVTEFTIDILRYDEKVVISEINNILKYDAFMKGKKQYLEEIKTSIEIQKEESIQ